MKIIISTRTITQENASIVTLTYAWTARALLVVSSATKPRIISSTHPPFASNAHLITASIARIWPIVPNATNPLNISSTNLQVSASCVNYKAVWIVSTTTTVPHVMNSQTTSSPTTVSARSVPLKGALTVLTPPTVPHVISRITISPSKMTAESVRSPIARSARVGTSARIVGIGITSTSMRSAVSTGFSTTSSTSWWSSPWLSALVIMDWFSLPGQVVHACEATPARQGPNWEW